MANTRDINLDIVAHDKTDRATRSAGRNLDRLERKTREFDGASKSVRGVTSSFVEMAATLKAGGVYAAVAAIAAGIAALPAVASLAAGGIVLALGGGLATLGLLFAARNKEIRKLFSDTFTHIQTKLQQISKPFEPVLRNLAGLIRRTFDVFTPALTESFKKMAPAVDRMFTAMASAVQAMQPAIGPVTDAFIAIMDALAPQLPGIVKGISAGIIAIAESIKQNPQTFASLVRFLGDVVAKTLLVIAALSRLANWFQRHPNITRGMIAALGGVTGAAIMFRSTIESAMRAGATAVRTAVAAIKTALANLPLVREIRILLKVPNVGGIVKGILGALSPLPGFADGNTLATRGLAPTFATAGASFAGAGMGGPVTFQSGPTNVDARVFLDGREIAAVARTVVHDELSRAATRARYGRRS